LKSTAITLAAAAAVVMAGVTGAAAQEKDVKIGVSIPAATHGWTAGVIYHAERTEKLLEKAYPGLDILVKTSPSGAAQANALEDLTQQNIDALVVLPFNSDELTGPVGQVKKNGTFVTVVDRGLKDTRFQDVYVAGNNPEFGRISGEYFKDNLKEGNIVILRGIPTVIDDERVSNFEKAIEGTDITVLDKQYANWNRDDAFKVMQDFLSKYQEIDAVWASDDDMAIGVLEAIKQAERDDIQFVLGGAGMNDMIKRVMEGDNMVPANVLYPPAMIATAMQVTVAHYYGSAPVRGTYLIASPLITQENAEQYYFPDSPY